MAHLTLVGISEDKARLLLVDDAGHEHTLDADQTLRAALRGDLTRLGQLEIQMESSLRPRDIQARIRAGESPEQVAQAAGTTADKIMAYAGPVLAERAHVAERAQRASVRRTGGEAAARTLGDAVAAHLRQANIPADSLEWDARRREDGRWTLAVPLPAGGRSGAAHFTFDPPGNYVVVEDDDARWLVGDLPEAPAAAARDDLSPVRKRRLSSVPADELPLGDDAIELVADTEDLSETASQVRAAAKSAAKSAATSAASAGAGEGRKPDTLGQEPPAEAFLDSVFARQNPGGAAESGIQPDDEPGAERAAVGDGPAVVDGAAAVVAQAPDDEDTPASEPPHRREVKKTRGRASVPSWDEIMFGGGSSE